MYKYPNYLMHYGVRGMKWGQRRRQFATSRLNRKAKKANLYQRKANAWKMEAIKRDASAREAAKDSSPVTYGRKYPQIKQAQDNAKQLQKYADHYAKIANSYIKKAQKKYVVAYDVSTGEYSLREKSKSIKQKG